MNKLIAVLMLLSGVALCGCSDDDDDDEAVTPAAGIASAKALVGETRTIAQASEGLQQPFEMFSGQILEAGEATAQARECIGGQLGGLSQAIADCFAGFADPDEDGTLTYNGPISCPYQTTDSEGGQQIAGIAISADTPAGHDTVDVDGSVGDNVVDLQFVVPRDTSVLGEDLATVSATLAGTIESAGCGAVQLRLTLGDAGGPAGVVFKNVPSPTEEEPDNLALDELDIRGAAKVESLGGSNPAEVAGSIEVGLLRCTHPACAAAGPGFNPDLFRIAGSVADADEEQSFEFEWRMRNARTFSAGDPVTSDNFVAAAAGVTAEITLAGQPPSEASVTVNLLGAADPGPGEINGTPFGNVTAEIQRATMRVTIVIENSAESPDEIERIVVTNEAGVRMVLRPQDGPGNVIGEITVGETKVANVERTGDGVIVIRYVDGTFETLT